MHTCHFINLTSVWVQRTYNHFRDTTNLMLHSRCSVEMGSMGCCSVSHEVFSIKKSKRLKKLLYQNLSVTPAMKRYRTIILPWSSKIIHHCNMSPHTNSPQWHETYANHEDSFADVTNTIIYQTGGINKLILIHRLRWVSAQGLDSRFNLFCEAWHDWKENSMMKGRKIYERQN